MSKSKDFHFQGKTHKNEEQKEEVEPKLSESEVKSMESDLKFLENMPKSFENVSQKDLKNLREQIEKQIQSGRYQSTLNLMIRLRVGEQMTNQ